MTANTPASRKAKGRRLQQAVRQDLIEHLGIDPGDILSTAMGQSGCDLYLSPAALGLAGGGSARGHTPSSGTNVPTISSAACAWSTSSSSTMTW